jgi:hypothetical protein
MATRPRDRRPIATETVPSSASVGVTVCEAVSRAGDVPIEALPPLGRTVDVDALDALFAADRDRGTAAFQYAGYDVLVTADGTVELHRESSLTARDR